MWALILWCLSSALDSRARSHSLMYSYWAVSEPCPTLHSLWQQKLEGSNKIQITLLMKIFQLSLRNIQQYYNSSGRRVREQVALASSKSLFSPLAQPQKSGEKICPYLSEGAGVKRHVPPCT